MTKSYLMVGDRGVLALLMTRLSGKNLFFYSQLTWFMPLLSSVSYF